MRMLAVGLAVLGGCATTVHPLIVSDQQRSTFNEVVREAEEAGALVEGEQRVAQLLADAKSDFEFAQHLPSSPTKARQVLDKAQAEAEMALQLVRRERAALRNDGKPAQPASPVQPATPARPELLAGEGLAP